MVQYQKNQFLVLHPLVKHQFVYLIFLIQIIKKVGISIIEGDKYQQAKKMYNDYAAQKGIAQDAGDIEPFKSQAILKWFADHPSK
jgi:hypothetical protein